MQISYKETNHILVWLHVFTTGGIVRWGGLENNEHVRSFLAPVEGCEIMIGQDVVTP